MSDPIGTGLVETKRFDDPRLFLDEMNAIDEPPPPLFRRSRVYRGHADGEWLLLPSAFRPDGQAKLRPLMEHVRKHHVRSSDASDPMRKDFQALKARYDIQTVTEVLAVKRFCAAADDLGLSVPGAERLPSDEHIVSLVCDGHASFPPGRKRDSELFVDVPFAFAQHHGIPTRYLDWTSNPLCAVYFAAQGRASGACASRSLCVWAALRDGVQRPGSRWVTVPRGGHGFLHAQDGLFSFTEDAYNYFTNRGGTWPEFEVSQGNEPLQVQPTLRKFVLEAPSADTLTEWSMNLLRFLRDKRISRSTLMPTLDNVAATTSEEWSWLS